MAKEIIISERENIAATLENGRIVEFFMNEGEQLVGDIILGKVESVVPSIDAAFVSIGKNRNGFIHVTDLSLKNTRRKIGIKNYLRPKQNLLVQIAKEATGSKGPRLTGMLTVPGKYMVLTPYERKIGISKRISDPHERDRLIYISKNICQSGYGIIVRTEAMGQSEEALKEDLEYLLKRWHEILKLSETAQGPTVLYRDQDLLYRVLRDAITNDVEKIIVDTQETKARAIELLQSWSSNAFRFVTLNRNPAPLALQFNLFTELEKSLQPKAPLPSGGYLIIEQTEALTVIDVNSGSTKATSLNETILQTNKEAAVEIGRQIRLRDIGGVIVVDFIDMIEQREQQIVWQLLANAVKTDKAQPQIGYFSEFSLLEMTRHRQRKSLVEMLTSKCPYCEGVGRIRNSVYRADVLVPESIKKRIPVPESMKRDSDDGFRNKIEDLKTNVDYVENKMDRIPPEVAKFRQNNQSNEIEYPKYDRHDKPYNDKFRDQDQDQENENDFEESPQEKVNEYEKGNDYYEEEFVESENISFSDEERQLIESIDDSGDNEFVEASRSKTNRPHGKHHDKHQNRHHEKHYDKHQNKHHQKHEVSENEFSGAPENSFQETLEVADTEVVVTQEVSEETEYLVDKYNKIPDEIQEAEPEEIVKQEKGKKEHLKKKPGRGRKPVKKAEATQQDLPNNSSEQIKEDAGIQLTIPTVEINNPVPENIVQVKSTESIVAAKPADNSPDKKKQKLRRIRSFSPKKRK